MVKLISSPLQPSQCPSETRVSRSLSIGLYQMKWYENLDTHVEYLHAGVAACASAGADVVFLPELTLSRYPADTRPQTAADRTPESLLDGPTFEFTRKAAVENQVYVQASLYEAVERDDGLGFNTAILVNPAGDLVAKTRKLHIPVTEGYFEDHYFAEGPSESPYRCSVRSWRWPPPTRRWRAWVASADAAPPCRSGECRAPRWWNGPGYQSPRAPLPAALP